MEDLQQCSATNASSGRGGPELTVVGPVINEWTLLPRQGLLEGLREIEQAPADDDIIVERHKEAHLQETETLM